MGGRVSLFGGAFCDRYIYTPSVCLSYVHRIQKCVNECMCAPEISVGICQGEACGSATSAVSLQPIR